MSCAKIGISDVAPPSSTANISNEMEPSSSRARRTYCMPTSMASTVKPFFSLASSRGLSVLTRTRKQSSVASVSRYTTGAPFSRDAACGSVSVNSNPPTAGPEMLEIWKTAEPQVIAFTKLSFGTSEGRIADDAGPENARPRPIRNSVAYTVTMLCVPIQASINRAAVQSVCRP